MEQAMLSEKPTGWDLAMVQVSIAVKVWGAEEMVSAWEAAMEWAAD